MTGISGIITLVKTETGNKMKYEAVRKLWLRSGLPQKAYAKRCGFSAATMTNILNGQKGERAFPLVAKDAGMTFAEFLDFAEGKLPTQKEDTHSMDDIYKITKNIGVIEDRLKDLDEFKNECKEALRRIESAINANPAQTRDQKGSR
jgi:hypothetical protein